MLIVSYGGISKEVPVTVTKVLKTLSINMENKNLTVADISSLKVIATYSDGTTEDVTSSCTFKNSKTSVATIDNKGNITAIARGKAVITASFGKLKTKITINVASKTN